VAMTNICRCGTYQRIRAAVHMAAAASAGGALSPAGSGSPAGDKPAIPAGGKSTGGLY